MFKVFAGRWGEFIDVRWLGSRALQLLFTAAANSEHNRSHNNILFITSLLIL
jgi:hypothetical protein